MNLIEQLFFLSAFYHFFEMTGWNVPRRLMNSQVLVDFPLAVSTNWHWYTIFLAGSKDCWHGLRSVCGSDPGGIVPKTPCLTLSKARKWSGFTHCCRGRCRWCSCDRDCTIPRWTCAITSHRTLIIHNQIEGAETPIDTIRVSSQVPMDIFAAKYYLWDLVGCKWWDWRCFGLRQWPAQWGYSLVQIVIR